MFTTFKGLFARTLFHAGETEGDEENSPDDTTQETYQQRKHKSKQ